MAPHFIGYIGEHELLDPAGTAELAGDVSCLMELELLLFSEMFGETGNLIANQNFWNF